MSAQQTIDEVLVRQQIDKLLDAIRAFDLDEVKPLYAPDMVSFDIGDRLQDVGAKAKWRNWEQFFATYRRPVDYELRDLTVFLDGDVAFGRSLNRVRATLENGSRSDYWVRWTVCFQKLGGRWLIAHDHVSVPLDPTSGRALLNLEP